MADEFRDSPFFGERVINFASDLLRSHQRLEPLTGFEKKLIAHRTLVIKLNEELDGNLVKLLTEAKDYIPPPTALRLLLYFQGRGKTEEAHKIIHYAARDEFVLNEEEVTELIQELRKDPELNVQLWLILLSKDPEKEQEKRTEEKLNLPLDFH